MNINKYINFEIVDGKSRKNNTYYAIVLHIGDVRLFLRFITKLQYETIINLLGKEK